MRQQKVYFDEYHTKVTQTIQQIESENQLLKKENQEMANLKQQVQSQKLNLQIVLDDAIHEKTRADLARERCHSYKAKLKEILSDVSNLQQMYDSQKETL